MLLRVNNDFLYLLPGTSIDIERQVKLFQDISTTRGDYSYAFELPKTTENLSKLGFPINDVSEKIIYREITSELLNDNGTLVYKGSLRVGRLLKRSIEVTFFSGNYSWMSLLNGGMVDLVLYQYDVDQNEFNITSSWNNTDGIIFPFIDTGTLVTRSRANLKPEDFVGCFYVKTLMQELFNQSGIKITGDLLLDGRYNNSIIATNTRSKVDVDNNSIYVGKNISQTIPIGLVITDVTFNLTSTPYFVGADASFTTSTEYTASADMIVDIKFTWVSTGFLIGQIFINGSGLGAGGISLGSSAGEDASASLERIKLNSGDVVKCIVFNNQPTPFDVTSATFSVIPRYIYKAFGKSCVPLWTKQQFVSNILRLFNVVTDYDPISKTVTFDLFDKIKTKEAVDISKYIDPASIEADFIEFISNYGKTNNFQYKESEEDILKEYNISSFVKYGAGTIDINNDFISDSADVVTSEFTSPISYLNSVFNCSVEKIDFVELSELQTFEITSVTDSAGTPRFNTADPDDFLSVNDLVRIELLDGRYNGEYLVNSVTSTYITVRGLTYIADTTGEIKKLEHTLTSNDDVYILYNISDISISEVSSFSSWDLNSFAQTNIAFAYFNMLKLGHNVEANYKMGFSFSGSENIFSFQRGLLVDYWRNFESIMNDPVMLKVIAYFPLSVFLSLTPLRPVYLKTSGTTNMYYVNRITGYKESDLPCEVELIKL